MSLIPGKDLWNWDRNCNMQWVEIPSTAHLFNKMTPSYGQDEGVHQESFPTRAQKLFRRAKGGIWTSFHMKK